MKTSNIILISIIGFIVLIGGCTCSKYNSLVKADENVNLKWGNVQSDYQRRADLIPNLVSTVKGVADFEKSTLTAVIEARAQATQMKVDASNLTPEKLKQFQAAQGQLGSALGRLMVISENYPQLKANENFRDLQAQLEGTENRIKVARNDFNQAVQEFNSSIRTFPNNILSGMFGFHVRIYFESEPSADKAPEVKF